MFGSGNLTVLDYRELIDNNTVVCFNRIRYQVPCNRIPAHSSPITVLLERYRIALPHRRRLPRPRAPSSSLPQSLVLPSFPPRLPLAPLLIRTIFTGGHVLAPSPSVCFSHRHKAISLRTLTLEYVLSSGCSKIVGGEEKGQAEVEEEHGHHPFHLQEDDS